MAPLTRTQLAWRARVETGLRIVAPALDLLLAAGDRVSRAVDRGDDELDSLPAGPVAPVPSRRRIGPGPVAGER